MINFTTKARRTQSHLDFALSASSRLRLQFRFTRLLFVHFAMPLFSHGRHIMRPSAMLAPGTVAAPATEEQAANQAEDQGEKQQREDQPEEAKAKTPRSIERPVIWVRANTIAIGC